MTPRHSFAFDDILLVSRILRAATESGTPPIFAFGRVVSLQTLDDMGDTDLLTHACGWAPEDRRLVPPWGEGFVHPIDLPTETLEGLSILLRMVSPTGYAKRVYIDVEEGDSQPLALRLVEILRVEVPHE